MAKKFRAQKSVDFTIEENGGVFGHLRIRPNAILWKPKNGQRYYSVKSEEFAKLAESAKVTTLQ
ncbi:MAG: hypothetical protein OXF74_04760 [Rhodobacteraceae bacterium]|nr:hypothetical protein [Paracoccaceae bacterium]